MKNIKPIQAAKLFCNRHDLNAQAIAELAGIIEDYRLAGYKQGLRDATPKKEEEQNACPRP